MAIITWIGRYSTAKWPRIFSILTFWPTVGMIVISGTRPSRLRPGRHTNGRIAHRASDSVRSGMVLLRRERPCTSGSATIRIGTYSAVSDLNLPQTTNSFVCPTSGQSAAPDQTNRAREQVFLARLRLSSLGSVISDLLVRGIAMRSIRLALGMAFIFAGMALGIYVTLHYFGAGILYIKGGYVRDGLILLLVWSELLGIVSTLALVIPGVLILRSLDRRVPTGARSPRPTMASKT